MNEQQPPAPDEPETPAFLEDGTPVTFQTFMLRAIPGEPSGSKIDEVIAEMERGLNETSITARQPPEEDP